VRQLVLTLFIAVLLVGGGFLMLSFNGAEGTAPTFGVRSQTFNPEANTAAITTNKALLFFAFSSILIGLLGGTATFFALIMWFLNRQVVQANQTAKQGFSYSLDPTQKNSIGAVLATNPAITIGVVIALLVVTALGVAIATGAFAPR
jgi:hypothetical protein